MSSDRLIPQFHLQRISKKDFAAVVYVIGVICRVLTSSARKSRVNSGLQNYQTHTELNSVCVWESATLEIRPDL